MTVSALVTRNDITATASQTSFTYTFRVLEATDMDVYQNGALLASGYTVNDVGVTTGGTVTLDVGVPVGQIVSLVLAMPLDRTTNYQNSGDFLAGDVNGDFDKIYIGAIQNENEGGRSLRLQDVEPPTAGVDMTLPLKAARLGKYLSFNSVTGAPEVVAGTGGSVTDASLVNYTPAGTGAVVTTVQTKLRESVSVMDFGATGDGVTDDTAAMQAAIDSGARWINIPVGVYLTSAPIVINSSVTLQGEEFNRSIIKKTTTTGGTGSNTMRGGAYVDSWTGDDVIQIRHLDNQYAGNVSIKDLSIQRTSYASGSTGIFAARTRKCNYENVLIVGFQYGYKTYDTFLSTFHRLEVLSCEFGISHLDDGSGIGSGTSCSFESCYVNCNSGTVNPSRGYNIFGLSYSTLTSCAIDNSNRTDGTAPDAYYLQGCRGLVLNGCGVENSTANVIHNVGGSNLVINGFRASGISGVSLGTTAYVYLDGGNITMTACDFDALSSPGTTFNWIIQSTTDLTEINQRTAPSGGNSFIGYGSNSTHYVISEGVAGTITEKGTFTPTVTPSTSGTITLTAAANTLYYERIGDIVHLQGWLQVSSVSSPVGGHLNVGALPYTPADLTDSAGRATANIVWAVGATHTPIAGIIIEASTTFRIYIDASTVGVSDNAYIQASYVTND